MKPSSAPKEISPAKARNATLLNLFATPGLGSLIAGRFVAGLGQLLLALVGFTLFLVWFVKIMGPYYSLMFSDTPPPPINWSLLWVGTVVFAASWFWSLATSIDLSRTASQASTDSLKLFGVRTVKLDEAKIEAAVVALPNWTREGEVITRTYEFKDFPGAMKFVNAVAALAEQAQHHPDIDVRWNKVTLAFTTHDAGGLTEKDFALARACDAKLLG
jgi:4a-hydroxytetrahydrobiopterin dehydratase